MLPSPPSRSGFALALALVLLVTGHSLLLLGTGPPHSRPLVPTGGAIAFLGLALAWWSRWDRLPAVLLIAFALRLILFPAPPTLSDDVYRYLWDGWLTLHGINPFLHLPESAELAPFHGLDLYAGMNSPGYYSVYPPVMQLYFTLAALAYPAGFDAAYYLLKALLGLTEFSAVLLLARLVPPRHLILYAWNPLVILETWGQPHGEGLLVAALVAGLAAWRAGRTQLSLAAFTAAIWIKLWPVLFLPFLLRAAGFRLRDFALAAALSLTLWLPFVHRDTFPHILQSLDLYTGSFEWNAGIYHAIKETSTHTGRFLGIVSPEGETSKVVAPVLRWVFLGAVVLLFVRGRNLPLEQIAAWILTLFLATLATVHPWYLVPAFALAPLFRPVDWPWFPLGAASLGTYLFYSHDVYWSFVIAGWGCWCGGYLWRAFRHRLPPYATLLPNASP